MSFWWRPAVSSGGCGGVVVLLACSFERQRVDLPSGVRYWSIVDERFERVAMFDAFLLEEARQNVKRLTKRELEAELLPSDLLSFRLKQR